MHKLVFYSTIVGVPACVNDAPSWTVLLWFTTDFRFYRHIVPHVYTFRRQLPLTRFITLPPPILFSLESPFLSNSKKFPFHFKKKKKRKRIAPSPLSWTGKIFHRLERQSRRRMLSWSVVDIRAIRRSPLLFSRSRVRPPPCTEGHRANGTRGCSIITKIGRYTRRPKRRPVVGCMRVPERERERGEWRAYGQIIDRYRAAFICRSKTSYCEKRERGGEEKKKRM